jgi:hypothetical protein
MRIETLPYSRLRRFSSVYIETITLQVFAPAMTGEPNLAFRFGEKHGPPRKTLGGVIEPSSARLCNSANQLSKEV